MSTDCRHDIHETGTIGVVACGQCRTVQWWDGAERLDPAEGIARYFGSFELIDRLPALNAPGREVLVYRPPSRRARSRLSSFPAHQWMLIADGLWLCHDGEILQLCPTNPLLAENLSRIRKSAPHSSRTAAPFDR